MDVDWLIAERPGKVKTLKQHPRKNSKRKLTAVCSHQTRIGNLDAHLI